MLRHHNKSDCSATSSASVFSDVGVTAERRVPADVGEAPRHEVAGDVGGESGSLYGDLPLGPGLAMNASGAPFAGLDAL